MLDPQVAAWIALGVGVGATVAVAIIAVSVMRQWRVTARTRLAASALVDAHRVQLESTMDAIAEQAADVGTHGAELASSVEQLRSDIDHMTWLFGRIPEARDTLRATLLDIVLPTKNGKERARDHS